MFQLLDVLAEDRPLRTCPQVHSRFSFLGMFSSLRSSDLCDSVGPVSTVLRSSGFLKLGPHGAFGSGPACGAGFPFSARRCVVPVFRRPSRSGFLGSCMLAACIPGPLGLVAWRASGLCCVTPGLELRSCRVEVRRLASSLSRSGRWLLHWIRWPIASDLIGLLGILACPMIQFVMTARRTAHRPQLGRLHRRCRY